MRVLLGIFLLVAAAPMMLHAAAQREAKEHPDLARLAAQFRVYRDIARKEQQTPEFRKWGGPVHKLMSEVGEYIEREHYPAREVTALLGKPDEIIAGGGRHNGIRVPRGESHWVYWWRGGHDYLYLVVRRGKVAQSRWWYAGE